MYASYFHALFFILGRWGALFMLINYTCYISHVVLLNGCCLRPITHFFMAFTIICYGCKIKSWVDSRMAWGWINESFEVLYGRCCMRREPGLCLPAIVWIARPCVAYFTELIMKRLNVLHANPPSLYVIKLHLTSEGGLEKEGFHGCN